MALRLGDYVVYGELYNFRHYSTHGVLVLRGEEPGAETIVSLNLTGNLAPDTPKNGIRFWPADADGSREPFDMQTHSGFQTRQIGPTGDMTVQGWVRVLPCSVQEYMQRSRLGEPPPTEWKRRLYLEWFSQNGRVVVEMADPVVEECVRRAKGPDDDGDWVSCPNHAPLPEDVESGSGSCLGITAIQKDGDGFAISHWQDRSGNSSRNDERDGTGPDALQRQLDAESEAIERALQGLGETDTQDSLHELELMDHCIECCEGEPVSELLGDMPPVLHPDDMDDESLEARFKGVLARLALAGIALDVCEHYTPREAYRLLVDKILPEERSFRELIGTGWVQHFSTSDFCGRCEEECLREYEEHP